MSENQTRRRSRILFLLCVSLFLVHSPASATSQSHDGGFFLRLSAGGASTGTSIDNVGENLGENWEFSSIGVDLDIAIGAVVSPNLALHGTLFGWSSSDPDLDVGSESIEVPGTLTLSGFGVGLTYYMMPANIYFSGTVGFCSLTLDVDYIGDMESDLGYALDAAIGKEWWSGDNWGLGIAGGIIYHSIPESLVDENWSGPSFSVRFTATRN